MTESEPEVGRRRRFDPLRREQDAFRLLLGVAAVVVVALALLAAARAIA
ncbi:hypothetical protein [Thermoleophilum album]|uniref:Uncharacterized protein n=1 Tax=Thermoleophilum album TaxID=29539 RepID=A0A1H6FSB8_THEAL|nr:hypothetical protein [Thermoleophilum album]SEH13791.1 hypothetical protein SAMN02745716_1322 [Thermoleophilum album]